MPEDNSYENDETWKKMLESIFGAEKAEQMFSQMENNGIDPNKIIDSSILPTNSSQINFLAQHIKNILSDKSGPINWKLTKEIALKNGDIHLDTLNAKDANVAKNCLQTANLWLDSVTALPPAHADYKTWTRQDWIENTLKKWKLLFEPIATNYSKTLTDQLIDKLPPNMESAMPGYMIFKTEDGEETPSDKDNGMMFSSSPKDVMKSMMSLLFAYKIGNACVNISKKIFSSNDIGMQLTETPTTALLINNIKTFANDLDTDFELVTQYLSVIECAYSRLFNSVPWLTSSIENAIESYASHIQIDLDSMLSIVEDTASISMPLPFDGNEISQFMHLETSEEQVQAQDKLEFLLAIAQGWVDEVCHNVLIAYLPQALPLCEMIQRHRVTQGPTEYAFKQLVNFEISPKATREARKLWNFILKNTDMQQRDNYWSHPDIAPHMDDLDNIEDFFKKRKIQKEKDEALDCDIQKLFDGTLGYADGLSPNTDSEGDQKA